MQGRAKHIQKYLVTLFQQAYEVYAKGSSLRSIFDHQKVAGLIHDTLTAKRAVAKKMKEDEEAKFPASRNSFFGGLLG